MSARTCPAVGPAIALLASLMLVLPLAVSAEVLLIERVQTELGPLPTRGASMAQVESRFGAPSARLDPRGGQKRQWPVIHRWMYPGFTVYFERGRVIDAVANKSAPNEVGPKPPIR